MISDKERLEIWIEKSFTERDDNLKNLPTESLIVLSKIITRELEREDSDDNYRSELPGLSYLVSEDLIRRGISLEKRLKFLTWKELVNRVFEEPKWIIENIIPERGLVAISGSPESGKSWFTEYLAVKIAAGEKVLDKFETIKTRVLLIDQENLQSWLAKRIRQLSSASELPIYIFPKDDYVFSLDDEEIFNEVFDFIKENKIGLVIIDTLRLAHNKEENSSTEMKPIFAKLKELTSVAAVIFLHHHRKSNFFRKGVSGEDMMGSITIRGGVDYQLTLTKKDDVADGATRINVTQSKSRYTKAIKPFEVTLESNGDGMDFIYQGEVEPEKLKLEDAKESIQAILGTGEYKRQEIIDQIVESGVCGSRTANEALKELVKEKLVAHTTQKPFIYSIQKTDVANSNTIYVLPNATSKEQEDTNQAVSLFTEPID